MNFARNLLEKYGWKDGEGLGKEKNGSTTPIRTKLKLNSHGVGYNPGEEFTNNWWERVFNDAAANIHPIKGQNGAVIQTEIKGSVEITTKKKKKRRKIDEGQGYGSFVKKSCLNGNETVQVTDSSSEDEPNSEVISDEQLFEICGGRTGHKGSRHGLTLSGKLARLEQQEKILGTSKAIENSQPKGETVEKSDQVDRSAKKSKKKKRKLPEE
ncbi:G-patch domain [Nesidiocoris tenuis]|uniref:G patch domain-containing protein 4 n=1 Tax=Nesidiocoris tenuis TaxID=355587 RepID=A0ABN7B1Q8_9HEMI|nr:G-patch domain [Nesidiocoris tenuis]